MRQTLKWLQNILTSKAVTFVAGVISSIVLQTVFGHLIPISQGLLTVLVIVFIIIAITAMSIVRQDIANLISQLGISAEIFFNRPNEKDDTKIYKALTDAITSSQESLFVVTIQKPSELENTPSRKKYYNEIQSLLEIKRKSNEDFRYERIIPVKDYNSEGNLSNEQTDSLSLEHCEYLLNLQKSKTKMTVRLRQMREGVCPVSFAIVDNKKIIFLIPSIRLDGKGSIEPYKHLGIIIIVNDVSGRIAKEMLNLFDTLRIYASDVVRVVSNNAKSISV